MIGNPGGGGSGVFQGLLDVFGGVAHPDMDSASSTLEANFAMLLVFITVLSFCLAAVIVNTVTSRSIELTSQSSKVFPNI